MPGILDIGISGLQSHKIALSVTGNNITNAEVEGYSRQRAVFDSNPSNRRGNLWLGTGVGITEVERIYDQFITDRVRNDTFRYEKFEAYATAAQQIDGFLADPGTGLQPGLERFFNALQTASDDPANIPARQVVITEADGLAQRFNRIYERLNEQNDILNGQLSSLAERITTLGEAIGEINRQIRVSSPSGTGNKPNALLDQRDERLRELSELVGVRVQYEQDDTVNVFIGNGQSLVVGEEVSKLATRPGKTDVSRFDLVFTDGFNEQRVTDLITGGETEGLIAFRKEVLIPAQNGLGRLAIALTQAVNDTQKLGIDLDGIQGSDIFLDINTPEAMRNRSAGDASNARPNDRVIDVRITDPGQLTSENYRVEFPGPNDSVVKVYIEPGNTQVGKASFDEVPATVAVEGMEITFQEGSFQQGDVFYIQPTRFAARDFKIDIARPEELALASPVIAGASLSNRGNATITKGEVTSTDTSTFAIPGQLSPPIAIQFTSATTYDVLDYSDPANPIPMFPPLANLNYVPGVSNDMLPADTGRTVVTSWLGILPNTPVVQAKPSPPAPVVNNGNYLFPEKFTVTKTNPETLQTEVQDLFVPKDSSAATFAMELNQLDGVSASARTKLQLGGFPLSIAPNPPDVDFQNVIVNGFDVTRDGDLFTDSLFEAGYEFTKPNPITPDFIADRINASFDLQAQGIRAFSDGDRVTIIDLEGDDVTVEYEGKSNDGINISNGEDVYLTPTGANTQFALSSNPTEGFDFTTGGPYTYEFNIPSQGSFSITLDGNHATYNDIIQEIRDEIENNTDYFFNGDLDVKIDDLGNISFQTRLDMPGLDFFASNKVTMGGQIKVVLEEDYKLTTDPDLGNLFDTEPLHNPAFLGYQVNVSGSPEEGDIFTVDFNEDSVADNRNGLKLSEIQSQNLVNGNLSINDSYAQVVQEIGSKTSNALLNRDAALDLLNNSIAERERISGVNLDEEAANLIRFELGYNASAQVISVARQIFDTLINAFR